MAINLDDIYGTGDLATSSPSPIETPNKQDVVNKQQNKNIGVLEALKEWAKQTGKSILAPIIRGSTYWQNILALWQDIAGGRYFWTEVPSVLADAERRRQEAKRVEEAWYNFFNFNEGEKWIARTTTDIGASLALWWPAIGAWKWFIANATAGALSSIPSSALTTWEAPSIENLAISWLAWWVVWKALDFAPTAIKWKTALQKGGTEGAFKSITRDVKALTKPNVQKINEESALLARQALKPSTSKIDTLWKIDMQDKINNRGMQTLIRNGEKGGDLKTTLDSISKVKDKMKIKLDETNSLVKTKTTPKDIRKIIDNELSSNEMKDVLRANPWAKEAIEKRLSDIENDTNWASLSQEDLQNTLARVNERIPSSTYLAQLQSNPANTVADTLLAKAIRNKLDDNLEKAIWTISKQDRLDFVALKQLEKQVAKRYGEWAKSNPSSLTDIVGMDVLPEIATGILAKSPARVIFGIGKGINKALIKRENNPNVLLEKAFKSQKKIIKEMTPIKVVKTSKITPPKAPWVTLKKGVGVQKGKEYNAPFKTEAKTKGIKLRSIEARKKYEETIKALKEREASVLWKLKIKNPEEKSITQVESPIKIGIKPKETKQLMPPKLPENTALPNSDVLSESYRPLRIKNPAKVTIKKKKTISK